MNDPFKNLWEDLRKAGVSEEELLEQVHGYRDEPEYWKLPSHRSPEE